MKFKHSNLINIYYVVCMTLGILATGLGITYFWLNGAININNISSVIEAQSLVQEIEKRNEVDNIIKMVSEDSVREAVALTDSFENRIKEINGLYSTDETFEAFSKDSLNHKNSLNTLISNPRLNVLYRILLKKTTAFFDYVNNQGWKTLTRTSRKLVAVVDNEKRVGKLDHKKLSRLHWRLNQDITYMTNITNGSVLSESDKSRIIAQLSSLKSELKMIKSFAQNLKSYENNFYHFKESFDVWLKDIKPGLSLKRLEGQEDAKKLILFLIAIVTYFFLVTIGGIFLAKKNGVKGLRENEDFILNILNFDLLKDSEKNLDGLSERFFKDFIKFKKYLEKRVKFGSYFQEALPIPAILLDSDLQLVWGNSHFYDQWDLEGQKGKENISWDYLQKFTNLGEEDPVITGFKNNIAGIYQIQIRTSPNKELIPFEMYVSPIKEGGDTQVMIFFYPLKFMEETLLNQSKTLIGPIIKTLDLFLKGNFNKESKDKIRKDFEIADITSIWTKFEELDKVFSFQKDSLFKEIEALEDNLYDKIKLIQDSQKLIERGVNLQKTGFQKFGELKESVVEVVDTRQEMEQVYLSTVVNSKELFQGKDDLLKLAESMKEKISQHQAIIDRILTIQKEFKEEKEFFNAQKSKIYQSLTQTLHFRKSQNIDDGLKESLENLKLEIKGLDKILESVNKHNKTLDILISKFELLGDSKEQDASQYHGLLKVLQDKVETDIFNLSKLTKKGHDSDEQMVGKLKNVYEIFLNNHKRMLDAVNLIKNEKITEGVQKAQLES
ncbi:MAG: hypothetical protein ACO2ZP_11665 [Bacteriovoracaceae bacterium]